MSDLTTFTPAREATDPPRGGLTWALVLLHCAEEPARVGEVALLQDSGVLGRQGTIPWARHRPGSAAVTGPLLDRQLSRTHLEFELAGDRLSMRNRGRQPLRLNRRPVEQAPLADGDLVEIGERVVLMVQRRAPLPTAPGEHPFGQADAAGIVGESGAAWQLRKDLRFVGRRKAHALIVGASGTGKELAARALHAHSARSDGPWIARNSATIPPSLADAELFGNCVNYPNTGTPERPGLIGAAHGGTLFLDEIGKLPEEVQVRLLRVLDGGEYSRLGEAHARQADLRFVGATNRDPEVLAHDVRARLSLAVRVPGLDERREDIPLIAAHLVGRMAADDPEVAARFVAEGWPRFSAGLIVFLATHQWTTHVRELQAILWRSVAESVRDELELPHFEPAPQREHPSDLSAEVIQACLDRHGGRQEPVWRELGLSSRHVLTRLVRKYNLVVRGREP